LFIPLIVLRFPIEGVLPTFATSNFPVPIAGTLWILIDGALIERPVTSRQSASAATRAIV
jgi:hypothetical protein